MAVSERCPHCRAELAYVKDNGRTGYRTIIVEIRSVYNGGLFYACPDCGKRWHRWPPGHRLRERAHPYVMRGDDIA